MLALRGIVFALAAIWSLAGAWVPPRLSRCGSAI